MNLGRGGSAARTTAFRERTVVIVLLIAVSVLAWVYTAHQAHLMDDMDAAMWRDMDMSMNGMEPSWTPLDALLLLVMWTVMMAAMMVPGTTPMVTAFATINRRRRDRGAPYVPTAIFLAGYLLVWAVFSILATALQWLLQKLDLVTTMMQSASYSLSAALFITAGLYQFSPLKQRCLAYCRSPDGFIISEWRDGALGAAVMGLRHGLFCLGCCAALMVLLFAVAVMDLRWVAALAVLVTAEKLLPGAKYWRLGIGAGLLAAGVAFAIAGLPGRVTMLVRDPAPADEMPWRQLWSQYNAFYKTSIPEHVTAQSWQRILDPASPMSARLAVADGTVVGFSNSVIHPTTWAIAPACYVEDLFIASEFRGRGFGRRLIADVLDRAKASGWSRVYWHTRTSNPARKLYDEFAAADDFVRYRVFVRDGE